MKKKIRKTISKLLARKSGLEKRTPRCQPTGKESLSTLQRERIACPDINGLNVIGHIYQPSGRGEDARTGAKAALCAHFSVSLINTFGEYGSDGVGLGPESPLRRHISTKNPYDINLFFLNADEMHNAYRHLGADFYNRKYNIACFAWELNEFPDAWLPAIDLVDELWAPSRFIQNSIAAKTDKPIIYMPLVVEYAINEPLPRSFFDLAADKTIFLSFFDFTSYFERKNPFAVVEAFQKACTNTTFSQRSLLVIKLNNWDHDGPAARRFEKAVQGSDNIIVIKKIFSDHEMKSLVNACDCLVSLHRSEGFGRGPAEAMALGKPVIVTGYSGNMDYCNEANAFIVDCRLIKLGPKDYPYGLGQIWADPDTTHAAECMQKVVFHPDVAREKALTGRRYITKFHSCNSIGMRYRRRLERIIGQAQNT